MREDGIEDSIDEIDNKEASGLIHSVVDGEGYKQTALDEPIYANSQNITYTKLKKFMPKGISREAAENVMKKIATVHECGLMQEVFEEQILSYAGLAGQGVSLENVVNALKYCNLKRIKGMTNEKAWAIVFPDKYDRLVAEKKFVDSHVSQYNSSSTVVKLDEMLMVPPAIQYAPLFHHSIKKLYELTNGIGAKPDDKVTAHVQLLAATELAKMTKMPEKAKVEIDIKVNQGSIVDEYEKAIAMMANAKLEQWKNDNSGDKLAIVNAPIRAPKTGDYIDAETI